MKVLMMAKCYMASHYRAGEPTGFAEAYRLGRKIHTIRLNAKKHFKDGDEASIRQWKGKPYRSKQVEIATNRIHLERIEMVAKDGDIELCRVNGVDVDDLDVCRNDGLDEAEFFDWFFPKGYGEFQGDILHFTGFRYAAKGGGCVD